MPEREVDMEKRQRLINAFLKHPFKDMIPEMIDYLELKVMASDVTDLNDLERFAERLGLSMGLFEEAWDILYAFNSRKHDEKELEKAEDHS